MSVSVNSCFAYLNSLSSSGNFLFLLLSCYIYTIITTRCSSITKGMKKNINVSGESSIEYIVQYHICPRKNMNEMIKTSRIATIITEENTVITILPFNILQF